MLFESSQSEPLAKEYPQQFADWAMEVTMRLRLALYSDAEIRSGS